MFSFRHLVYTESSITILGMNEYVNEKEFKRKNLLALGRESSLSVRQGNCKHSLSRHCRMFNGVTSGWLPVARLPRICKREVCFTWKRCSHCFASRWIWVGSVDSLGTGSCQFHRSQPQKVHTVSGNAAKAQGVGVDCSPSGVSPVQWNMTQEWCDLAESEVNGITNDAFVPWFQGGFVPIKGTIMDLFLARCHTETCVVL